MEREKISKSSQSESFEGIIKELERKIDAFAVPAAYQHRVLFWGIIGALIMRAILAITCIMASQQYWSLSGFKC